MCPGRAKLACSTTGPLRIEDGGTSKGWSSKRLLLDVGGSCAVRMMKAEASRPHSKNLKLLETVEEFDEAGLEGVFGADHFEAIVLNEVFQNSGTVAQLVGRSADVGADGFS